jgi:RNA polymerase sigma factor (TIGR02999 family)
MGDLYNLAHTTQKSLLRELSNGNKEAMNGLMPLVYDELRKVALSQIRRMPETLNPDSLVSDFYLRFSAGTPRDCQSREHFTNLAAKIMRELLIDRNRKRVAVKRGSGQSPVEVEPSIDAPENRWIAQIGIEKALAELESVNPRSAQIVRLRLVEGFSLEEVAEKLAISLATTKRALQAARAFIEVRLVQFRPSTNSES